MPTEEEEKKAEEEEAAKKKEEEEEGNQEKTYSETQVKSAMGYVVRQNEDLQRQLKEALAGAGKKETEEVKPGEMDLESMSRSDFSKYLMGEFQKTIGKPLGERISKNEDQRAASAREGEVTVAAGKHGDFWEYQDEIRALAKTHPSLDIESLYALARHASPDKVAAGLAKVKKEEREVKKKEEEDKPDVFGGLLPTSGVTKSNTGMSSSDAAQAAAESVQLEAHLRAISRD